jgi:1-acyl-sn-glycerol-3-phosphate acyltransferase
MVLVGCFFLKRDNPRDGMRMIKKAAENIRKGNSMVIFPEGTRNKHEDEALVQEFHAGSFHIAQKSGCKIVPMAISGTADVFENHLPKVRPGHVIIQYGEPIDTSALDRAAMKKLPDTVRDIILKMREEHMSIMGSKK